MLPFAGEEEVVVTGFPPSPAAVAQLVEHNVANVVVVGSNPISRSSQALSPKVATRMSTSEAADTAAPEETPLQLEVTYQSPEACLREVLVTIPRGEIERYLKKAYDDLVPEAQVPGFRAGRAPRKLVEKQFKERVVEQVKGALVMDSLSRVTETQPFSAISEPNFDFNAVVLPDEGDFVFQFSVEVRPEFPTPQWKGLKLTRPVEETSAEDVDAAIRRVLARYGEVDAVDGPAAKDDQLLLSAVFEADGRVLSELEEMQTPLTDRLSFSDGICANFGEVMTGATEGETRQAKVVISANAEDEGFRGKEVDAAFRVIEVQRQVLPKLTPALLEDLGDFGTEEELREFIQQSLQRQVEYRQQQAVRQAVVELLAGSANFELPADLVRRQTARELQRKVLELRRNGFSENDIRKIVNVSRQNAQASTELSLREHFILEQIAEELKIDAEPADYDAELELIARQSDEPVRRVRARLEKSGQMDALRNQIIERKVLEVIVAEADITDEPVEKKEADSAEFAVYHSVLGTKDAPAIPQAMHDDSPGDQSKTDQAR